MNLRIVGPQGESQHVVYKSARVRDVLQAAIASHKLMGLDDRDTIELAYNGEPLSRMDDTIEYLGLANGDVLDLIATGHSI